MRLFEIAVVDAASDERFLSQAGIIRTKLRNRLGNKRVTSRRARVRAGLRRHRPCGSVLFMMRGTWCWSAQPCSACVRYRYPALFSTAKNTMQLFMWHSVTLWGWHTTSWIALGCLVPLTMLLMMHPPHLVGAADDAPEVDFMFIGHGRLDQCNLVIYSHYWDEAPEMGDTSNHPWTSNNHPG